VNEKTTRLNSFKQGKLRMLLMLFHVKGNFANLHVVYK